MLNRGRLADVAVPSLLFVALYLALAFVAGEFPHGPIPVYAWSPHAGLALATVLVGGARFIPAVFVAAVAGEAMSQPLSAAFLLAGGLASALACTATALVLRHRRPDLDLARLPVLRDFIGITLAGTGLGALAYVSLFVMLAPEAASSALESLPTKWLGDFAGVVTLAPLLVALVDRGWRPALAPMASRDGLFFVIAVAAVLFTVFWLAPDAAQKFFYLLFLPLAYLATRRDFPGAVLGVAVVQIAAGFVLLAADTDATVATEFELAMVVVSGTALLLGAVASERERALADVELRSLALRVQHAALADATRIAAASETAATLTHEMSQPLSAIGTYARAGVEMLRRNVGSRQDLESVLERIERETRRSSEIVQRIREFFRTSLAQREQVGLPALIDDTLDVLHDRIARNGVRVQSDIAPDLPPVLADRAQIALVLHSLLANALDAIERTPVPHRIRIAARTTPPEIEVDIEDSGPGISDAVASTLFEPLATTKPAGIGLGLAICRTIVQAHGGRLWLVSPFPTLFRFTLPLNGPEP